MAYSRIHRLVAVLSALFVAAWSGLASAAYAVAEVFNWHNYVPDIRDSLRLDRMAQVAVAEPQGLRRYLSFRLRALLHDLFTGSGFVEPQAAGTA